MSDNGNHPDFEDAADQTEKELTSQPDPDGRIRVVDDKGHLIFKYNPATRAIEIKVPVGRSSDKAMFQVSTDTLRNAGATNFISNNPTVEVVATRVTQLDQ